MAATSSMPINSDKNIRRSSVNPGLYWAIAAIIILASVLLFSMRTRQVETKVAPAPSVTETAPAADSFPIENNDVMANGTTTNSSSTSGR